MVVKKQVTLLALVLCIICILSSCKSNEKNEDSTITVSDTYKESEAVNDTNSDSDDKKDILASTADASRGVPNDTEKDTYVSDSDEIAITYDFDGDSFFYDKDLYYNELILINTKSNDKKYVCDVPGCLHDADSENCTIKEETPYYYFSAVYNDKISYYNFDKKEVRLINTDGSDIRTLAEVNEYDSMIEKEKILVGSHLYSIFELCNTVIDEEGYNNSISGVIRIYDLDFDSEKLSVIYESDKVIQSQALFMCYSDYKLCFSYQDQTKKFEDSGITQKDFFSNYNEYYDKRYDIQGLVDHIIILDLRSGKSREIVWKGPEGEPTAVPLAFINNVLYYHGNNGIYSYDLENDEQKTVCSGTYYNYVYQSADFILLRWSKTADYSDGYEYAIIENGDDNLKKIKIADSDDFYITDECYAQLKVQYYDAGINSAFDPKRVKFMDREEFKNMFK